MTSTSMNPEVKATLPSSIRNARALPECPKFASIFGPDFRVLDTFGKGSCFFHAWAAAITEGYDWIKDKKVKEAIGIELRQSVYKYANEQLYNDAVQFVKHKYEQYAKDCAHHTPPSPTIPSFHTFRRNLKNTTVWADLVMISFVAYTFNFNLLFWSDDDCAFYYGCDRLDVKNDLPTIIILWHNHVHFETVVQVKKDGTVKRQFHWPQDSAFLSRIQKEYNSTNTV